MPQDAPDATEEDVERIVRRDYPANLHDTIRDLIQKVDCWEKTRVIVACLKNGGGDFKKLEGELANASGWWREILGEAEYPNYTKVMFRIDRLPPEEKERIVEKDKAQYLAWFHAV